jgi:hypothetical protein
MTIWPWHISQWGFPIIYHVPPSSVIRIGLSIAGIIAIGRLMKYMYKWIYWLFKRRYGNFTIDDASIITSLTNATQHLCLLVNTVGGGETEAMHLRVASSSIVEMKSETPNSLDWDSLTIGEVKSKTIHSLEIALPLVKWKAKPFIL